MAGRTPWPAPRSLDGAVVEALAEIVERSGPEDLEPDLVNRLLTALGVGGLELRDAADGRLIWQFGSGFAGTEVRHGKIAIVPLGGEVHEGATWRLLTGILELFVPANPPPIESEVEETGFFGISAAARSVRRELCELGPTHLPILLVGETGVGKEVAARALHRLSERRGAFVPVNVAAIPANLLEAELFGSVKGAYTGADRARQGLAVAADRGTLFLDEVGDLDPPLQVKLLRFLDSQEVRPVGATQSKNGRCSDPVGDQLGSRAAGEGGWLPPGSLLPHRGSTFDDSTVARASGGHRSPQGSL